LKFKTVEKERVLRKRKKERKMEGVIVPTLEDFIL